MRERLEAIVAQEARCCPFLTMRLREDSPAGVIVLEIEAPEEAGVAMSEVVGAFGQPAAVRP